MAPRPLDDSLMTNGAPAPSARANFRTHINRQHALIIRGMDDVWTRKMKMRCHRVIAAATLGLMISISIPQAQASEVWVRQARGRVSGGTPVTDEAKPKSAPEGGSTTAAAAGSPTNPATCNQQNASSPACYSATQQSRGK